MHDPNFPPNLNIRPLELGQADKDTDEWGQKDAIGRYGIAGRVWEATRLMTAYLTPPLSSPSFPGSAASLSTLASITFDPPCPLFNTPHRTPRRILELGSGQSVASLHLAQYLQSDDMLVLTDLPEVVPLCQQGIERCLHTTRASLHAAALPWGGDVSGVPGIVEGYTHILLCDLIYFPHLYPLLLQTLLEVTEPRPDDGSALAPTAGSLTDCGNRDDKDEEVFGPIIIMSYKPRTLSLEQPFFDSLSHYFRTAPVVLSSTGVDPDINADTTAILIDPATTRASTSTTTATSTSISKSQTTSNPPTSRSDPSTPEVEEKLYICQRWRVTPEWRLPRFESSTLPPKDGGKATDESSSRTTIVSHAAVMNGLSGVVRGRDFGYTEQLFAALEWD